MLYEVILGVAAVKTAVSAGGVARVNVCKKVQFDYQKQIAITETTHF